MAVFAKKKGGNGGGGKEKKAKAKIVQIEEFYSDCWQLEEVARILKDGGVGVIPTDTCYSFVTPLSSLEGVRRLMALKGTSGKKPLSILCKDISMASQYADSIDRKWVFKLMKATLPGPFTYILPSTKLVPKQVISGKAHLTRWRRKEIGVRIPDEPIVTALFDDQYGLNEPLLCGSVPGMGEDVKDLDLRIALLEGDLEGQWLGGEGEVEGELGVEIDNVEDLLEAIYIEYFSGEVSMSSPSWPWANSVDVVVDAGIRGGKSGSSAATGAGLSTVVDLTGEYPAVLRAGLGVLPVIAI
ncbi:DHBP synthase RibB-like alpha/beta domain-containing protein [Ochromonadaceae sp. CCMP2298]|nr:DHBP synthase RibB-like alpha/beta domain-containing protein [Ochromonadaceae sp. CCMP2298]